MAQRVLVTGSAGNLGKRLRHDAPKGIEVIGTDRLEGVGVDIPNVDLSNVERINNMFASLGKVDGVIHPAAYVQVDKAEDEAGVAWLSNHTACKWIAGACHTRDIPLVMVSTDFVFDGTKGRPYIESDAPNPLSVYGKSKWFGERSALELHPSGTAVVRTQGLYGPDSDRHFVATMLRLAKTTDIIPVVDDQLTCPTSTTELAPALWDVLLSGQTGIFHAVCEGWCTWHDFAFAIFDIMGMGVRTRPITTEQYNEMARQRGRVAQRPADSRLYCDKLAKLRGKRLAHWREPLQQYLAMHQATS